MRRTYSELVQLPTFTERLRYLLLDGIVAAPTFGANRYLNQKLYRSADWQRVRRLVIIRDGGNDLGVEGYSIEGAILIHHINPITEYDIINMTDKLIDPENVIITSGQTHNIIHYGSEKEPLIERKPGDTILW